LEVWFDFAQNEAGAVGPVQARRLAAEPVAPPPARWPEVMQGRFGDKLYDYAIVRVLAEPGQPLIPNGATPRCLWSEPLDRGDSLYVVGYPRGERARVHDNARVYLPYRVPDGDLFARLRLDIEADLLREDDRAAQMRSFDASYIPIDSDPIFGRVRFFYDIRDGGQPRMGIVADTFQGDSGGPVFDHDRDQCVVGILNRGMPDTGTRLGANWKQNERVLPVRAILDDLKKDDLTRALLTSGDLVIKPKAQ
jgi:hypothetical protein